MNIISFLLEKTVDIKNSKQALNRGSLSDKVPRVAKSNQTIF